METKKNWAFYKKFPVWDMIQEGNVMLANSVSKVFIFLYATFVPARLLFIFLDFLLLCLTLLNFHLFILFSKFSLQNNEVSLQQLFVISCHGLVVFFWHFLAFT